MSKKFFARLFLLVVASVLLTMCGSASESYVSQECAVSLDGKIGTYSHYTQDLLVLVEENNEGYSVYLQNPEDRQLVADWATSFSREREVVQSRFRELFVVDFSPAQFSSGGTFVSGLHMPYGATESPDLDFSGISYVSKKYYELDEDYLCQEVDDFIDSEFALMFYQPIEVDGWSLLLLINAEGMFEILTITPHGSEVLWTVPSDLIYSILFEGEEFESTLFGVIDTSEYYFGTLHMNYKISSDDPLKGDLLSMLIDVLESPGFVEVGHSSENVDFSFAKYLEWHVTYPPDEDLEGYFYFSR